MAEYHLTPAAEQDLESIWTYTLQQWGAEQANQYTDNLIAVFAGLAQSRGMSATCDHSSGPKHPSLLPLFTEC